LQKWTREDSGFTERRALEQSSGHPVHHSMDLIVYTVSIVDSDMVTVHSQTGIGV
jgi:hypothetical protein